MFKFLKKYIVWVIMVLAAVVLLIIYIYLYIDYKAYLEKIKEDTKTLRKFLKFYWDFEVYCFKEKIRKIYNYIIDLHIWLIFEATWKERAMFFIFVILPIFIIISIISYYNLHEHPTYKKYKYYIWGFLFILFCLY